ncbi:transposase, IS903.B [Escherichia coli]|uniref:Transposase, IS903.B n=1 Tax=Escherichia coli TaxID=562 RepID=A0A377BC04_ECOLX|nr:transposase, IS903.B [Escherichia coli]
MDTEYNRRSIAETAMYRMKQLLGDSLTLRDYDGQVAEAMAMVRAFEQDDKGWDARKRAYCLKSSQLQGRSHEILFIQQSHLKLAPSLGRMNDRYAYFLKLL